MKKLSLVVALLVLAIPASAPAKSSGGGHKNAARECKALRAQMGAEKFRAAFAGKKGKNAFGRCVSTQRKARKAARKRARRACRSKGLRGRAMKRCVREQLAADPAPKPADYEHAVDECEAEQAEDPEDFTDEFGDGPDAFGNCVAEEADGDDEADEPESEPEDEGTEDPADGDESPADEPEPEEL